MARHISNLYIETFRGIKDLELNDLGDINVLVGANNCGKTTLLEAIMLLSKPDDFSNVLRIARLREAYRLNLRLSTSFFDSFLYLFDRLRDELLLSVSGTIYNKSVALKIHGRIEKVLVDLNELMKQQSTMMKNQMNYERINESDGIDTFIGEMQVDNGDIRLIPYHIPINFNKYDRAIRMERDTSFLNMTFISTVDHIAKNTFRDVIKNKDIKKQVVEILKIFDDKITDLRIIEEDGRINQVVDNDVLNEMPLSTYGDGIKKVVALANGIAEAKNGVLLVDEIETSIHTSALREVLSFLFKACKENNVQLFVTTHSLEVVDAMLTIDNGIADNDMLRVITVVKRENQTVARILTGEKALQVRDDYDMELRS